MNFNKLFNLVIILAVVLFIKSIISFDLGNDNFINGIFISIAAFMMGFFFKMAVQENRKIYLFCVPVSIVMILLILTLIFT